VVVFGEVLKAALAQGDSASAGEAEDLLRRA
jgi:hypothetical protein